MTKVKTRVKTRTIVIMLFLAGAAAAAIVATQVTPSTSQPSGGVSGLGGTASTAPGTTVSPGPCIIVAKEQSPFAKDGSPKSDSNPLALFVPQPAEAAHLSGGWPVEVRSPAGTLCPAKVRKKCFTSGESLDFGEVTLSTGQGTVTWSSAEHCASSYLIARCTASPYNGFRSTHAFSVAIYNINGTHRYVAGNDPNISDGTVGVETDRPDGTSVSAYIEWRKGGQLVAYSLHSGGLGQVDLDPGTYIAKAISHDGWTGTLEETVVAGETHVRRVELPTPPPETATIVLPPAPTTATVVSIFDGPYPQVAGQVCDAQNHPITVQGALRVETDDGLPLGQMTITKDKKGKFELFKLARGTYRLFFAGGNYAGEKTIEIPLKVVLPTGQYLQPGTLPSPGP